MTGMWSSPTDIDESALDDVLDAEDMHRLGFWNHAAGRRVPLSPRVWLEDGVIEAGCVNKLTGASGSGKTLAVAHMAVSWSQGFASLDVDADGRPRRLGRPQRVAYIDGELGPRQWHRILDKLDAPLDLPNFHLLTLTDEAPTFPALCAPEGAARFLEFIAACGELDVIVLDTLSAFVGGEENSNDTWSEFDRLVTLPLKKAGFTVVYVDHTGHDNTRARGGSAKKAKLDVEWVLDVPEASAPNSLRLTNAKMRNGFDDHPRVVHVERRDNPLGHVRVDPADGDKSGTFDGPAVLNLILWMDRAKLPVDGLTKRAAIEALRAKGHKFDDKAVMPAITARKNREKARKAGAESLENGGDR